MSVDDEFLRSIWPQATKAIEYLVREDGNLDGILEGQQRNTLDEPWYGKVEVGEIQFKGVIHWSLARRHWGWPVAMIPLAG